jgi:hypothetical protein
MVAAVVGLITVLGVEGFCDQGKKCEKILENRRFYGQGRDNG